MSEDDIDSFILKLHSVIETTPLLGAEEGFDHLYEFVHQQLDHYCTRISHDNRRRD